MQKENKKNLYFSIGMLAVFVLWTVLIQYIDVRDIGPHNSSVGFSALNGFVHATTGVHMTLYNITDWLGLVPVTFALGFATLGLIQWLKRKSIKKVDYSILVLGGFYIVVMAVYLFFETVVINYRPVLINGYLEASYPSSTTILVMCVMTTAAMQLNSRIRNSILKQLVTSAITLFIAFMVIGRLVCGVHWFTDIIGGAMLSSGLVMLYRFVSKIKTTPSV